jgi:EAL domain-containing protein (putative c-di-GMP-specific phosphodiesterase class I)
VTQDIAAAAESSSVVGGEQASAEQMRPPSPLGQPAIGARDRIANEVDIVRSLLDEGGITIAMQPIVLLSDLTISGWEALLRGEHPQLGPIPPVVLVEVAQQAGLLDELTKQVAELALAATARAAQIAGEPLRVTVNVELEQLYANGPFIEWLLEQEIPKSVLLTLEVTERGGDEWTAANEHVAELLVARGIDLGLDDVGAGHSRIGFFRHRKWDIAKIDQSFLTWATERDRTVIELFVYMIHGLDLASLAEGIETAEHLVFAQSLGIKFGQGYWLGRPATVSAMLRNLRRNGLAIETSAETSA